MGYLSNQPGDELPIDQLILLEEIADLGSPFQYLRVDLTGFGLEYATLPSGGSQTPWTSDIDAASYDLNNVGNVMANDLMTITADTGYGAISFASPVNGEIGGIGIEGDNPIIIDGNPGDMAIWSSSTMNFSANSGVNIGLQITPDGQVFAGEGAVTLSSTGVAGTTFSDASGFHTASGIVYANTYTNDSNAFTIDSGGVGTFPSVYAGSLNTISGGNLQFSDGSNSSPGFIVFAAYSGGVETLYFNDNINFKYPFIMFSDSTSGRLVVNKTSDDGTNQLQVEGNGSFSGFITARGGLYGFGTTASILEFLDDGTSGQMNIYGPSSSLSVQGQIYGGYITVNTTASFAGNAISIGDATGTAAYIDGSGNLTAASITATNGFNSGGLNPYTLFDIVGGIIVNAI